ncbi:MAG: beta-lactamase family protein [Rhizobacter sp.]|nr:beta-lactamase family protein [Rhizobacter sp.]
MPPTHGLAPDRLARITTHLERHYIQPGKLVGCQTLVARRGQVAYRSALGQMDRERGKPLGDDTVFRIYSMTKPITSVALMMLYEQGHFQLNDAVSRVIPEWREQRVWVTGSGRDMQTRAPARPVTFRHLLTHSGGITYGGGPLPAPGATLHPVDEAYEALGLTRGGRQDLASFVKALGQAPLRYEPGERWMYSFSTDVCGYLVQALSGMPFEDFLQRHIFEPLGMHDTAFHIAPEKVERFAANYVRREDKSLALMDDPQRSSYARPPVFVSGGGGLVSSLDDYLRFCEMLRRGGELDGARIIGPRTLQLMTQNHLPGGRDLTQMALGSFSETANEGIGFGLGFATTIGEVAAGSYGPGDFYWGGMASTLFWVDPREDLVVIFMTQLVPSGTFNLRGQLKNLVYSAIVD